VNGIMRESFVVEDLVVKAIDLVVEVTALGIYSLTKLELIA
jgi:hypothetical protein